VGERTFDGYSGSGIRQAEGGHGHDRKGGRDCETRPAGPREEKYRTLFETMGQGYCDLELLRGSDGRAVDQRYLELDPCEMANSYERALFVKPTWRL
jgi:hypothetical protein